MPYTPHTNTHIIPLHCKRLLDIDLMGKKVVVKIYNAANIMFKG